MLLTEAYHFASCVFLKHHNMKKLYFSIFFSLSVIVTMAGNRSSYEKLAIAKTALKSIVSKSTRAHLYELKTLKENAALTVIGYEQKGYVIIANDERINAIIGYSDQAFQENNPGLNWWLKAASEVIEAGETTSNTYVSTTDKTAIPQLLISEWGQAAPFNNLCPVGKRGKCPTGCVATAMAQVLYYQRYPEKAIGRGSCTYGGKTIAQDLSGVNYAWDKMQPRYETPSGEGCDDVATLLYDCGLSINMDYDDSGSGSYNFAASTAMKKNFSLNSIYCQRDYYTASDWMEVVYEELSHHNPVIYGGLSYVDGNASGHSFVIDGYRDDGLVHVNWGWNGLGNGYYDIALLNPVVNADSMSFSSQQDMVICQKEPLEYHSCIGMNGITIQKVSDNSFSARVTSIMNLLPEDFKGQLAIIAERNGKKNVLYSTEQKLIFGLAYSAVFEEPEYSVSNLEDGEYRLYAASKSETDSDWQIFRAKRGGKNSYVMTKGNGTISLKADNKAWTTSITTVFKNHDENNSSKTPIYNLNGQQVDGSYHGVVIKNGKKYVQ